MKKPLTSSDEIRCAVVFTNPIEFHGTHLPLTTDYEISRGMLAGLLPRIFASYPRFRIVSEKIVHRGAAPAPGPGSESTPWKSLAEELTAVATEIADAPESERANLVLFMTFHGAPRHAAAIERASRTLRKRGIRAYNPFNLTLLKLRDYDPAWVEPFAHLIQDESYRAGWVKNLPRDFHGGTFETSMVLVHAPEKVGDHGSQPDCAERSPGFLWRAPLPWLGLVSGALRREWEIAIDALHWERDPEYRGYTGAPRHATRALGERFTQILLEDYLEGFRRTLEDERYVAPLILQWSVAIT